MTTSGPQDSTENRGVWLSDLYLTHTTRDGATLRGMDKLSAELRTSAMLNLEGADGWEQSRHDPAAWVLKDSAGDPPWERLRSTIHTLDESLTLATTLTLDPDTPEARQAAEQAGIGYSLTDQDSRETFLTEFIAGRWDRIHMGHAVAAGDDVDVDGAEYEAVRSLRTIRERVEGADYERLDEMAADMRTVARTAGQWTDISPLVDRELRHLNRGSWGIRSRQEPPAPPTRLFNLADTKADAYANEHDLEYEPRSGFRQATNALLDRSFARLEDTRDVEPSSRLREARASLEHTMHELHGRSQSPERSEDPGRSHGAVPFEQHSHETGPTLTR